MLLQQRYRLVQLIGQGGNGKTYLAVDESQYPTTPCVIKQFLPQNIAPLASEKATELFHQQAQRLLELGKHPQIPALLTQFEWEGHFYIVQEFIDGTNLATELDEEGTFSEAKIWHLLSDLLPVLKFIHDRQVIHRDIKPENIIRCQQNRQLVLVDFGAAKLVTELDRWQTDIPRGSPEYVAPEQVKGKAVCASDLYSLGVTCIYLLTGIPPFDLLDVAKARWAWQEYLTDKVSSRLAQILDKLIQNAVKQRFQSADEVMQYAGIQYKIENPKSKIQNYLSLTGHSASVNSVAISPDGDIIASASDDKTIRLWNLNGGQLICTLSGHSHFVKSVAFSPDGKILASSSDDRTIKIWDLNTRQETSTLSGHSRPVKSVAFSFCGKFLASGSWDKTIQLWDVNVNVNKFEKISTLTGHKLQVSAVAFSRDGNLLASASFDRTARVWDLTSNLSPELLPQLRYTFTGHTAPVFAVAFSPDSGILATGSDDNTIILWDLKNGQPIHKISGHSWSVVALAFTPNGKTLVSGSWDKTVKLWRVSTGEEIATLSGHLDSVYAVAVSRHANLIASGSKDKTVALWQPDE